VRRREFITLLAGAAALPIMARGQQAAMPMIGFLNAQSSEGNAEPLRGFRQGLQDAGYIEGYNVAIEYRWANNKTEQLPTLAADLVRRRVAVIAATGSTPVARAAKAATTEIPIVFTVGDDPVRLGLVGSLARPGGNLTGVNFLVAELTMKRLELLRTLVPGAARLGVLLTPATRVNAEATLRDTETAARSLGLQIQVFKADTSGEIDAAFASMQRERPDALLVAATSFFLTRRVQLVHLATRHAIPAAYAQREFAEAGGLMSYGSSITDAYRQVGIYTGRILKGAKPAQLPVVQSTKLELVINLQIARMLGLAVPPSLLATADEVIE
jgi:putative tryptophan/tyrosine transport system substrate-binding protein